MSKLVPIKDFEIHKVKVKGKKGLDIEFFDKNNPNELWSVSSDGQPHEDFFIGLLAFKEVLAYSLGLLEGWDFAREHNRKNDETLSNARQFWLDEIERCTISGFTVVGYENSKGIKIIGALQTELGPIKLTSPTIRFDAQITNSVDEIVMIGDLAEFAFKEIEKQIWSFIYKSKRGGELFESGEVQGGLDGVVQMSKVG
jgi:hypothetical protein